MDSQEQYEALLARWGFEDRTEKAQQRRLRLKKTGSNVASTFRSLSKAFSALIAKPSSLHATH